MTTSRLHRRPRATRSGRIRVLALSLLLVVAAVPATAVQGYEPPIDATPPAVTRDAQGSVQPTVQYQEAVAHAGDRIPFTAGERVTVPFAPRASDRWTVAGESPRSLPAGRLSGRAIRNAVALPRYDPKVSASDVSSEPSGPVDTPWVDPRSAVSANLAAAVDPGGLRREVFGFLPYWELTDPSTRLDWPTLSTIAYFGVGAAANGDLQRKNADGSTTVGWSGWTSSKLTGVINTAHANGTRVVLTVQSFAWSSSGVTRQKALLGSATARGNLARQIAAAVRDRGADGVNLDFEPIVSTYGDEFTALVRSVRAELNRVARGYQLTFDATGWIGNYPIEAGTAAGAADAVVVMGYDYRGASSNPVGSVAPIGGPSYDIADTVRAYLGRASRIEGHPRRAVLRPRLVDRQRRAPRQEHLGDEERRVGDRRLRHGPGLCGAPRSQVGRAGGGRLDGLPTPELHGGVRLRDPRGGRSTTTMRRPSASSTTPSITTTCAEPASGRSATTARARSCTRCSRRSSSPTPSRPRSAAPRSARRSSRPTATGASTRRRSRSRSPVTSASAGRSSRSSPASPVPYCVRGALRART